MPLSTSVRFAARIVDWPGGPLLVLLALCLAVYLPGVVRLPAVDRTEIQFAETSRDLVARGAWVDPRYGSETIPHRPIGTFWAQGIAAKTAGLDAAGEIAVYRLPSLIAVTLAVLALYCLAAPRIGRHAALLAAGLFGVAPLTVLVSQLAIADGLALLPATVAMLCLMRLYDPEPGAPVARLALLFWSAMGAGMLVNALHTPILVGVTLIALALLDRDFTWLARTRPLVGLPIALLIAAPWIAVRTLQDGVPFSGLGWAEWLAALGGAQDMKLRAFPGTFLLAALIGFLPGVALLPPAVKRLWDARGSDRLAQFLITWVLGYLVYLELMSSKPGTYTVQVLFPAMAMIVALYVTQARADVEPAAARAAILDPTHEASPHSAARHETDGQQRSVARRLMSVFAGPLVPWPPMAALFALVLLAAVPAVMREVPSPLAIVLTAAVAGLFAWSAHLGRRGDLAAWAVSGVAALALFAITLLGVVLPGVRAIWPAREALAASRALCGPVPFAIIGFREPSASFVLGAPKVPPSPDTIFSGGGPALHVIESRWRERYLAAASSRGLSPTPVGCVAAYNVMRGCPVTFSLFSGDASANCRPDPATCAALRATVSRPSSKGCD